MANINQIRLVERLGGPIGSTEVRFFVTPELSESRNVNYQEISEIRQSGGLLIYIGTPARTYQLNARMVSRTPDEADITYSYTHRLKGWTVPTAGQAGAAFDTSNVPTILKLYGYGTRQIRGVPVVITSLNIDYPAGVSYIQTTNGLAHIPIIQTFSIALKEARTEGDVLSLDLAAYKEGTLQNW